MMDSAPSSRGGQTFLAQLLQGIEDGAEPRLMGLDDATFLVVRTIRDQALGEVGEEIIVVP